MKPQQEHAAELRVFFMADAVHAALPGQTTPQCYSNIERMLGAVIHNQGRVKACGTCIEARGRDKVAPMRGIEVSTMSQLTPWGVDSDRMLTFQISRSPAHYFKR